MGISETVMVSEFNGNDWEFPYCGNDCKNDREYACAEYSSDPDGLIAAMEEDIE